MNNVQLKILSRMQVVRDLALHCYNSNCTLIYNSLRLHNSRVCGDYSSNCFSDIFNNAISHFNLSGLIYRYPVA